MRSYQRRLTLAASQIFFIGGMRNCWKSASALATSSPLARRALNSATASSIARRVPEPIEKCAVRSASPSSTTRPALQRAFQIAGKLRQCE